MDAKPQVKKPKAWEPFWGRRFLDAEQAGDAKLQHIGRGEGLQKHMGQRFFFFRFIPSYKS